MRKILSIVAVWALTQAHNELNAQTSKLSTSAYNKDILSLTKGVLPVKTGSVSLSVKPTRWNKSLRTVLGGTQTTLVNWAAGGASSISTYGSIEANANYQEGYLTWTNNLMLGYGVLRSHNNIFASKTDDRIDFVSSVNRILNPYHSVTNMFNLRTQFANGYTNAQADRQKISSFFAPGYLLLSAGWTFHPTRMFNVFASPTSGRFTFVRDSALSNKGFYGVDKGKKVRPEFGFFLRMFFEKENFSITIARNVSIQTTFEMYWNYLNSQKAFMFNLENLLTFKINEYINCSLNVRLLYDQAVKFEETLADGSKREVAKLQWKEILGLGLTYDFSRLLSSDRK